jgi:hypothetical protein
MHDLASLPADSERVSYLAPPYEFLLFSKKANPFTPMS